MSASPWSSLDASSGSSTLDGDAFEFVCDRGRAYWVDTIWSLTVAVTCGSDGEWLGEEDVECETIYCSDPPDLQHSTLTQPSSNHVLDDVITYRCDVGYKVNDGNEYTSTCSVFAMWSVDSEQCQRKKIHEKCT